MHFSTITVVLLAGLSTASPVPETFSLAEPDSESRDLINFTEIARDLGINEVEKREQRLWAVYSNQAFETISAPVDGGQNTIAQSSGFTIINPAGNAVFYTASCGGGITGPSSCNDSGQRMAIRGLPCMGGQFIFGCVTDGGLGLPKRCAVWKDDASPGNLLDVRNGGSNTFNNFLSTGYKSRCIVTFTVPYNCAKNAGHPGVGKSTRCSRSVFWHSQIAVALINGNADHPCRPLPMSNSGVPPV